MNSRKIHESAIENDVFSDTSIFAAKIPTLKKMASYQIAIEVWYNYIKFNQKKSTREPPNYLQNTKNKEENDCDESIQRLGVPRPLEEKLKKYLRRVRQETIDCQSCFKRESPSSTPINRRFTSPGVISTTHIIWQQFKLSYVDLNSFVWFPNGRIDYRSTAIKLSSLTTLTEAEKFLIMSNYCLENEIKNICLHQLIKEHLVEQLSFKFTPLQFYWYCYLKNEIRHNIPLLEFNSRDVVMATKYYDEKCWEGFQYFWDRMSAEDQVSFISKRLRPFDKSFQQRRLFFKMSQHQLINLLSEQPIDIIKTLMSLNLPEYTIWVWELIKDEIPKEKFFTMMNDLLLEGQIQYDEKRMSVFFEIWNTAQDPMFGYYIVNETINNVKKVAPSAIKFLVKFLNMKSENYRRNVILESTSQFAFQHDFDVVGEIFDLCLPNQEDKMEFFGKNDLYLSPYFCQVLYSEDDFNELSKKLLSCIRGLNLASNFVKAFIESRIMANKFVPTINLDSSACGVRWERLSTFIEEIFQENISTVLKMKKSYISSFDTNSDRYERYGSFNELAKLVELEFIHENLHKLRCSFSTVFQETLQHIKCFDILMNSTFKNIFSWCFKKDAQAFQHFKRNVPIEDIFNAIFRGISCEGRDGLHYMLLCQLDVFLLWYFSGETAELVTFKSKMKNDSKVGKILTDAALKRPCFHKTLLEWFPNSVEAAANTRLSTSPVPPPTKKRNTNQD